MSSIERRALESVLFDRVIAYHASYARVGKSVTAGIMLAQLLYWHDRGSDPDGWVYKTQAEWEEETALSRREQETARLNLRERGILHEIKKGVPAKLYFRLDIERLIKLLANEDGGIRQTRMALSDSQGCTDQPRQNGATSQTSIHKMTSLEDAPELVADKHQIIWQSLLAFLAGENSKGNFETYYRETVLTAYDGQHATILCPNTQVQEWLEHRCQQLILRAFQRCCQTRPALKFVVRSHV